MPAKNGKPVFSLIAVCTIDGKIARHSSHMTDWSSKEDKDFLHKMLDSSDAVVVGRNTYEVAKGPLSKRNCIVFTSSVAGKSGVDQKMSLLAYLDPERAGIVGFCSEQDYMKVAVLGGTRTFTYFLQRGLADEIFLTIEPLVFGEGLPLFDCGLGGAGPSGRAGADGGNGVVFDLVSVKKLNNKGTVLLHYKRH